MTTTQYETREAPRGSWVRWGPAFAGAISAIAVTAMVMSLWLAIGYGSNITWFVDNMQWFFLGTALASLLFGGIVAGVVAGKRGVTIGAVDGMMVWGLVLVASLIPLSLRALEIANNGGANAPTKTALGVSSGNLWALFGVLVGGLACTLVGGVVGSSGRRFEIRRRRPSGYYGEPPYSVRESSETARRAG